MDKIQRRPITVVMIVLALTLLGLISAFKLPVELKPNGDFRHITIHIPIKGGMAPEEVEKLITKPVEDSVSGIFGLKSMFSEIEQGSSRTVLLFESGVNMNQASIEVREKFAQIKPHLPKEADQPVVAKYSYHDQAVASWAIAPAIELDLSLSQVSDQVERELKSDLLKIDGVAQVDVVGGQEQKVMVILKKDRLLELKLSIDQVIEALGLQNINAPLGQVHQNQVEWNLKAEGRFHSLGDIQNLILHQSDQETIYLKDVADISLGYLPKRQIAHINGEPAVLLLIRKESLANTLSVMKQVLQVLDGFQMSHAHLHMIKIHNDAEDIQKAMTRVIYTLLWGAILAALVLAIFFKSVVQTACLLSLVPLTLIMVLLVMHVMGISLNILSLSGLAIGVGMIVDGAVIVLLSGVKRVWHSLLGSTLTSAIVFVPLLLAPEELKLNYGPMSLVYVVTLLVAYALTMTWFPVLLNKMSAGSHSVAYRMRSSQCLDAIKQRYGALLAWSARHKGLIVNGCMGGFVLMAGMVFIFPGISWDATEESLDQGFVIHVQLPPGTHLSKAEQVALEVEQVCRSITQIPVFYSEIKSWSPKIYVKNIKNSAQRKDVLKQLKEKLKPLQEKAFIYIDDDQVKSRQKVEINVLGPDYEALTLLSNQLSQVFQANTNLEDVRVSMVEGVPEVQIKIEASLAEIYGLTVQDVAQSVHAAMRGLRATYFMDHRTALETVVRLQSGDWDTLEKIKRLPITTRQGESIELQQIARLRYEIGPGRILRKDKQRMMEVSATLVKGSVFQNLKQLEQGLSRIDYPAGTFSQWPEHYREEKKNQKQMMIALLLALVFIYMVLAALTESYGEPLLVMANVPLAVFVVLALEAVWGYPLSFGGVVGLILLAGLSVNSALVLLEAIKQEQAKERGFVAVRQACLNRVQSLMITTLTTVIGLVPMLLEQGFWRDLALSTIVGLLVAMPVSMILLPIIYSRTAK